MQIDPSVSQAFATLETAFHTDFLNRLPSRHNLMYRQFLERQFMLRIGTALVTLPESVDQLWIAHLIQRYFWHELDFPVRPKLPTELPRFLWSKSFRLPEIDLVSLSQKIETLRQQKFDGMPDPLCIAERKLFQLEMLLHLQPTEIALIELAYASSPDGWPQSESEAFEPDRHALHALLMCLNWCDVAERDHIFSILLNVSTFDVAVLFTNPSTLLALHLIDSSYWHQGNGAFAYATATEKLFMVLETQYLTNVAMLADLQSPPFDAALAEDSDVPDVLLHEQLPRLPHADHSN